MAEEGQTRKERERRRHRRAILDTARELFAEQGYHCVSMNQVARRSEFAVGTLYRFFKGKEELYETLVLEGAAALHEILAEVLNEPRNEYNVVRDYIRAKTRTMLERPESARLYYAEPGPAAPPRLREELERLRTETRERLDRILCTGVRKGFFRSAHPQALCPALEGLIDALLQTRLESPAAPDAKEIAETVEEIFFRGTLASWAIR
jgi:AcrR family transcriptional regulator